MKVRVSRTVKAAFGRSWRKEVAILLEAAQAASEGKATRVPNRRHDADSFHSQQEGGDGDRRA